MCGADLLEIGRWFLFSIDFTLPFLTVHVFGDLGCLFSFCIHSSGFVLCVCAFLFLRFLVMLGYYLEGAEVVVCFGSAVKTNVILILNIWL